MTQAMWSLGHTAEPIRLAILLSLTPCLLIGLTHYVGFRESSRFLDHLADAFVGVAALIAAILLALFGLLEPGMARSVWISSRRIQGRPAASALPPIPMPVASCSGSRALPTRSPATDSRPSSG